jgi:hypothetical protein
MMTNFQILEMFDIELIFFILEVILTINQLK